MGLLGSQPISDPPRPDCFGGTVPGRWCSPAFLETMGYTASANPKHVYVGALQQQQQDQQKQAALGNKHKGLADPYAEHKALIDKQTAALAEQALTWPNDDPFGWGVTTLAEEAMGQLGNTTAVTALDPNRLYSTQGQRFLVNKPKLIAAAHAASDVPARTWYGQLISANQPLIAKAILDERKAWKAAKSAPAPVQGIGAGTPIPSGIGFVPPAVTPAGGSNVGFLGNVGSALGDVAGAVTGVVTDVVNLVGEAAPLVSTGVALANTIQGSGGGQGQGQVLPGGAYVPSVNAGQAFQTGAPNGLQQNVLFDGINTFGESTAQAIFGDEGTFFRATQAGARARSEIVRTNPISGRMSVWKYAGRPVLYSGDLSTCKRVRKIAAKARRARP